MFPKGPYIKGLMVSLWYYWEVGGCRTFKRQGLVKEVIFLGRGTLEGDVDSVCFSAAMR
jgi:hypothetical protein